ncbi:hypothetical protein [Corynebacterium sp. CNJ-954]|jgi:hypothetical protein|uniref:hypothetical protein n=1 Tax=Corynebacterium sp. CNJ-954 TaxID=1904962 RepID=UPI0011153409|nr:hypothetical protein [Corynebacterium sp. CNJ-954]
MTGISSLVVGVLATSLAFTLIGSGDGGGGDTDVVSQGSSTIPTGVLDEPVVEDDEDESQDDVIGVGDGFTVTTWDGIEIETYVHDFSVDESCKYGQPVYEPQKAPDSRIVQLAIDVSNHGNDSYLLDSLTALSAEGYTQPVDTAFMYCEEPNDGANRWIGSERIEKSEKKLLYGAFEVQPDAAQLVLVTTGNGKVLIDIPEHSTASDADGGSPEPTTSAG